MILRIFYILVFLVWGNSIFGISGAQDLKPEIPKSDDPREITSFFETNIIIRVKDPELRKALPDIAKFISKGEYDKAIDLAESIRVTDENRDEVYDVRMFLYLNTRNLEKLEYYIHKSLKESKNQLGANLIAAMYYSWQNNPVYMEYYYKAYELNPEVWDKVEMSRYGILTVLIERGERTPENSLKIKKMTAIAAQDVSPKVRWIFYWLDLQRAIFFPDKNKQEEIRVSYEKLRDSTAGIKREVYVDALLAWGYILIVGDFQKLVFEKPEDVNLLNSYLTSVASEGYNLGQLVYDFAITNNKYYKKEGYLDLYCSGYLKSLKAGEVEIISDYSLGACFHEFAYGKRGRYKEVVTLSKLIENGSFFERYPYYYEHLVVALIKEKQFKDAKKVIDEAIEYPGIDKAFYVAKVWDIEYYLHGEKRAIKLFEKYADEITITNIDTLYLIGDAYTKRRKYKKAIEIYARFLKYSKGDSREEEVKRKIAELKKK